MLENLIHFNSWFPKYETEFAEQTYYFVFAEKATQKDPQQEKTQLIQHEELPASLAEQIRGVRKIMNKSDSVPKLPFDTDITTEQRVANVEATHRNILQMLDDLKRRVEHLEINKQIISGKENQSKPAADTGDDIDLFGSDDEEQSEETKKRLADYASKKAKKEQVVAKSTIVLDVKPWDDETDLDAMEQAVRSIEADGLVWGPSKRLPVAFGVKKLQIGCVVEDDKIGTDFLEEKICEFEDYVQSVDVVSFNKI